MDTDRFSISRIIEKIFRKREQMTAVTAQVDDSSGWGSLSGRPHEYDQVRVQENYTDALTAWRKNPFAWRIIAITTDYVVGERITVSSPRRDLQRFIDRFWHHPQNRMDMRLESMCDELARSGDLFVLLFRNPQDGMSYIRFVTKDRILKIETTPNDWENEQVFYEQQESGASKTWMSPRHPDAEIENGVMLHYAVNRPVGALLGESDLVTMIPWLQRYSRMLEDRVRLHWAVRAFLWVVTVPGNKVKEKLEQYRAAPESGSIIVKDESEQWQAVAPLLHGADSEPDLKAVRNMIDAGSGYPPHWRGEPTDTNLATAIAMQAPTERHLARRQKYFVFMLQDILYHAYFRAVQAGKARPLPDLDYGGLFNVNAPEISRNDNARQASAAMNISAAFSSLLQSLGQLHSPALREKILRVLFKFAGEPLDDEWVGRVMDEIGKQGDQVIR
ncbi:MAG: hypothetical protein JW908_12470 [Anaerolineales bacterium]|nr:hypothetical protein [Anaerolineales bacterium]